MWASMLYWALVSVPYNGWEVKVAVVGLVSVLKCYSNMCLSGTKNHQCSHLWSNILNFTLQSVKWILICPCPERYWSKSKMAPPSWGTTYLCNHAFIVQIFRRLWCSHRAGQHFDSTGLRFDFDFGVQCGSVWTVQLNARIRFQPVENSSVAVWT